MFVSRIALFLALAAIGYLAAQGDQVSAPAHLTAGDAADVAQLALELSPRPSRPALTLKKRPRLAHPVPSESKLSLVAHAPVHSSATIHLEGSSPFQLIAPEIKATPELIPGHWNARPRLLTDVFDGQAGDAEPWISELQTPQVDRQPAGSSVPRAEAGSKRGWSVRR